MSNDSSNTDDSRSSSVHAKIKTTGPVIQGRVVDTASAQSVRPVRKPRKQTWGPLESVLYALFLYVAVQLVAGVILILVLYVLGSDKQQAEAMLSSSITVQFVYLLLVETATIAGVAWFLGRRGISMRRIGWDNPKLRYLGIALVGFGAYFLSYIVISSVVSALVPQLNFDQKQNLGFDNPSTSPQLILTFISLVILPPLAEETLFRGFLFGGMRNKLSFLPAAILTSLIFGMGHLEFGNGAPLLWVAAMDTFVLSLVLCYVREKSGSLWPGIFIHAGKNGLAFVALFLIAR